MEEAVLAGLKAESLMRADPQTLRPGRTLRRRWSTKFLATPRQRLFVVGDQRASSRAPSRCTTSSTLLENPRP